MRHQDTVVHYEIEIPDFTESSAFKAYVKAVESVIRRSGRKGISTAGIHAKLGKDKQHWTLTAISFIADVQTSWKILPTLYWIEPKRVIRNAYGSIPAVR